MLTSLAIRYGLVFLGISASLGLRLAIEAQFGSGLPTYLTFYPMVMAVALLAGLGPGVLATALAGLTADYYIIPPIGHFSIVSPIDQVALALFIIMGLFISLLAELYRRNRNKAFAYDQEVELRKGQEVLREGEKRFQTMVNAMPQLGWIARPDGYITWYNERWYEYTGTTPDQIEGWGWQVVHDEVELPKVLERWKTSIATGNAFEMTFPLRGADGNFRMFLTRIFPLKDAAGRVEQWFGTNTDVDEQIRADKLLRESEARYRSLVEQAIDGIFLADSQGHYIDVNTEGCKMLGYSREEVLNLTLVDVLDPTEIPRLGSELARFAFGELIVNEWLMLRKDGSKFLGEIRGRQLINGDFQGIVIDITERKNVEMLLKKYKLAIDTANDGYWTNDITGNLLDANEAYALMSGYSVDELIEMHITQLDAVDQPEDVASRVAKIIAQGQDRFETVHRHKDGHLIDIEVSVTFMPEVRQFFVFCRDITESKRIKQELIVLNNHLAREVTQRTADLSDLTAHIQNIAETEKANLARELHDELGSTLVGISMEVGRLRGKITSPEYLQDLTVIKSLLTNAVEIKRKVVSQLYPTVLDNYGVVAAVEWLVKEYRNHSGIEVELHLPKEDVVMEQTFALAAYRITQECLTNIAKHARASTVHIEIKINGDFLDLNIHDNGKGLSNDVKKVGHGIFGMIERARFLGGSMEVGSEDGKGTTAHLRLPLAATKLKNKKRVLVVDDHAIMRDAIKNLLDRETEDFSVEGEAADGNAAVQMAIERIWDVILLDISLPKMNGIQVLEAIMAVKPKQPIIMLSSSKEEEYGEIARSKGAAFYIEKGETGKLVEAMRRAMLLH